MKDQLGRSIFLTDIPKRIVSLVPSQTELICDLGLESAIVGITKFCVHPKHLISDKQIVGGTKQVHFEKIRALNPDIILCNKEENSLEMVMELEKIAPTHVSDISSIGDCLDLIKMYGLIFSKEAQAENLCVEISRKHEDFERFISQKPTLKVAYFIWKNPWMVAAKQTFIDAMLGMNHFDNYYKDLHRYPEVKLGTEIKETADVVLLSSEPFPFKETHKEEMRQFFPTSKIMIVDGEMFSWYGTRLLKAFDYFKTLHPDILK